MLFIAKHASRNLGQVYIFTPTDSTVVLLKCKHVIFFFSAAQNPNPWLSLAEVLKVLWSSALVVILHVTDTPLHFIWLLQQNIFFYYSSVFIKLKSNKGNKKIQRHYTKGIFFGLVWKIISASTKKLVWWSQVHIRYLEQNFLGSTIIVMQTKS